MQRLKVPIQHSDTFVGNIGGASIPTELVVLTTETGARTTTGASQTTKSFASTSEIVNIGDVVKYLNIFISAGPRNNTSQIDSQGWLEWALVMVKESETSMPITNVGTRTIGDIATKMYRNECIWTGQIPLGLSQPNTQEVKIKVPSTKQRIRIGDEWRLYIYFRDLQVTSVSTDAVRYVVSDMYKSYS